MAEDVMRLRIFQSGEIALPQGWPDDVAVAVLSTEEGPEVFPVHVQETPYEVLDRLTSLSGRDLAKAAVYPPVEGHAACDLSFSAVAGLAAEIENFLARFPEAADEADDFAVNFGFAAAEGIAFPALLSSHTASPPHGLRPPAPRPVPAGYSALDTDSSPFNPSLRVTAEGEAFVHLDTAWSVLSPFSPDFLVSHDGLSLAVATDALRGADGALRTLRLPTASLPWLARDSAAEIPLRAVERDGYLFLFLSPEWAWRAKAVQPVMQQEAWRPGRLEVLAALLKSKWTNQTIIAATVAAVATAGLLLGRSDHSGMPAPTSVASLRSSMFD